MKALPFRHVEWVANAGLVLSLLLGAAPSRAQEDIPTYKTTCGNSCPHREMAIPISRPSPIYPHQYQLASEYVEALVEINFTIGTDGHVKNILVEHVTGPQEFADTTIAAVEQWQFKPAMEDGKPVEQNTRLRFKFKMTNIESSARPEVGSAYDHAAMLARDQRAADAIAALKDIIAQPRLNFYERTMVAYSLAELYIKTDDEAAALGQIRDATIDEGAYLDKSTQKNAIRLRVGLEAAAGNLAEAFEWFEILKRHASVAADDPTAQLIAKLHEAIDAPTPLAVDAKVPPPAASEFWQHTLLRRTFTFTRVQGKLDRFQLRCDQHGIESPVSDRAEWTVPKSWSGCVIYVSGPVGTQFQFVELQPIGQ